jgi:hypothetical protein
MTKGRDRPELEEAGLLPLRWRSHRYFPRIEREIDKGDHEGGSQRLEVSQQYRGEMD